MNIVKFGNANLPAASDLSAALRTNTEVVSGGRGQIILKMDRSGHWVYGADQTEVDRDSLWAVNPFSFVHGYIAWGEGEVLAEKMVSITEPLPEVDVAPPQAKRGWETQIGMLVKCIEGDDNGIEALYTVTSVGGRKAMHALAMQVADQLDKDQAHPVPVVNLTSDYYQHKAYGRVYTPVFEVQEWISLNGDDAAPVEETPTRRRRG